MVAQRADEEHALTLIRAHVRVEQAYALVEHAHAGDSFWRAVYKVVRGDPADAFLDAFSTGVAAEFDRLHATQDDLADVRRLVRAAQAQNLAEPSSREYRAVMAAVAHGVWDAWRPALQRLGQSAARESPPWTGRSR